MAGFGHVAVGMAAGRLVGRRGRAAALAMVGYAGLSLAPDLDVIGFAFGVPYEAPLGHRGASHALLVGLLGALAAFVPRDRRTRIRAGAVGALVLASHGLLDTLTDGGLGAALLWPFDDARFFAPWRPIPVSPIGLGLLSARGARVFLTEIAMFAPLAVYALWPRRGDRAPSPSAER